MHQKGTKIPQKILILSTKYYTVFGVQFEFVTPVTNIRYVRIIDGLGSLMISVQSIPVLIYSGSFSYWLLPSKIVLIQDHALGSMSEFKTFGTK